eukprot:scaffold2599_cov125-Cylindrotheca_fusiformis.AAC.7
MTSLACARCGFMILIARTRTHILHAGRKLQWREEDTTYYSADFPTRHTRHLYPKIVQAPVAGSRHPRFGFAPVEPKSLVSSIP